MVWHCPACEPSGMSSPEIKELVAAIAARLRALRQRRSLTQEAVAEKAGLPVETISRAENARMMPTLATLAALSRALDVTLADLVDPGRPIPEPLLTPDEHGLVEAWRKASPRGQELVTGLLAELAEK